MDVGSPQRREQVVGSDSGDKAEKHDSREGGVSVKQEARTELSKAGFL